VNFINENCELECEGENVEWFSSHDSRPLPKISPKYQIESVADTKSRLTIQNIDLNDNGKFTCVSRSSEPQAFELKTFCKNVRLSSVVPILTSFVFAVRLSVESFTVPVAVKENGTAVLRCKATGVPSPDVEWFFDDEKLGERAFLKTVFMTKMFNENFPETTENVKIFNGGLTLMDVKAEQAGTYSCLVTQKFRKFKNVREKKIQLVVECKLL
jgi:Immunoglobulin I-set domain